MSKKEFTPRQEFIFNNPRKGGESIRAWSRRLYELNPTYTALSYKDQICRWRREGVIVPTKADLVLRKMTVYPDGSESIVKYLPGEEVDTKGLAVDKVTTSPYGGQWVKYKNTGNLTEEIIDEVLHRILDRRDFKKQKYRFKRPKKSNGTQMSVVITDDHIGLDTNYEGISLFPYRWNKQVYEETMDKITNKILAKHYEHGTFDEVVITGLGDLEDGWDRKTTRGGHDLPQNMSNDEVFDLAVDSRLEIIDRLVKNKVGKKIVLRLVTNSNHTQSFALVVAKSIKKICDKIYDKKLVEIDILKKFIEHRGFGDHCILYTHGKDAKEMKAPLPVHLNDRVINYIKSYIEFYDLKRKYKYFYLFKGDSHRFGVSEDKSFRYISHRALCPPSNWAGTNFGDVQNAGYSIYVMDKHSGDVDESHPTIVYEKDI